MYDAIGLLNGVKPRQTETYNGTRDLMTVSTRLYEIEQYISLCILRNTQERPEDRKVIFSSSFRNENAAGWSIYAVSTGSLPTSLIVCRNVLVSDFVAADHNGRARDLLR